ncbi:MAG: hypothetical protein ACTSUB_06500 [Candidatus Thorarchaeota archaeon]
MLRVKWPKVCIGCGTEDIALAKGESADSSFKVSISGFGNITYHDPNVERSTVTSTICTSCQKEARSIIQQDLMPKVERNLFFLIAFSAIEVILIFLLIMDNIPSIDNLKGVILTGIILNGVMLFLLILPSYLTSKNEIKNITIPLMKVDQIDKVGHVAFVFRSEKFTKLFKSANPNVQVFQHPCPHQIRSIRMELMD